MNVLSLFSGIGGLDLGLERAGMTIAGQVEIDPWCRKVLAKHWPEVPRHDDVRTCVQWWGDRRAPDVVAGGAPCQPVSVAGPQLAQADDRWLWPAFACVVRVLRPRFVLLENVPGLLGHGFGDILGDLAGLGYDAEWDCVPAAFVGAPHVRRRVFLVAYPGSPGLAQREGEPENAGQEFTSAQRGGSRPRAYVADAGSGRHESPQGRIFARRHSPIDRSRWPAEPGVGRVVDEFPGRVDRLRGLGNAVVPQVAEYVGRLIMEVAA